MHIKITKRTQFRLIGISFIFNFLLRRWQDTDLRRQTVYSEEKVLELYVVYRLGFVLVYYVEHSLSFLWRYRTVELIHQLFERFHADFLMIGESKVYPLELV